MSIGNYHFIISKKKVTKLMCRLLGTLDLHTHIRLKPVIVFFQKYFSNYPDFQMRVLELGCGSGVNAFELYKIAKRVDVNLHYTGVDFSPREINVANIILRSFRNIKSKISFYQEDANKFLEKYEGPPFDIILLIDVIEHIENHQKLLYYSKTFLKDGGIFVVSVPTLLYPKIFGRNFASKIGHLVDGYSLLQIDELFKNLCCERIMHKYNTGLFSNIGCWLYYNKLNFNNKYLDFLKSLILYPFKFIDFYNNSQLSCSLFAIYKKNNEK